ncbi:MAG: hypothetical protein CM15mP74_05510 [Halieaceae bacterium]|nr:MAG: hypothetical protein CM15mP74_05510 [Halieaceae bacterium]
MGFLPGGWGNYPAMGWSIPDKNQKGSRSGRSQAPLTSAACLLGPGIRLLKSLNGGAACGSGSPLLDDLGGPVARLGPEPRDPRTGILPPRGVSEGCPDLSPGGRSGPGDIAPGQRVRPRAMSGKKPGVCFLSSCLGFP